MGARVEGKKKKKSIKANVTSKFGSKRKLSRMGKVVKKGTMGPSTEYVTRSAALKRLQITLKDFRRLCILKGIYPRVPEKAPKGSDKIYYDIKDLSYIMHEPLLQKFRDFKAFMKKIRKAAGRNQFGEARRKNDLKPEITLDHLVKERYPRFIDALRDLDDALCMIHVFAALPTKGRITADRTSTCASLARHWQYYIAKSKTLSRVFVSVKGVYFQAEIMGEPVTWLVPHQFTQHLPREVDFRVMLTFLEFYEVFMKFVLYKLYHMQDMKYPPDLDEKSDKDGALLMAVRATSVSEKKPEEKENTPTTTTTTTSFPSSTSTKSKKETLARLATLPKVLEDIGSDAEEEEVLDEDDEALGTLAAPLENVFSGSTFNRADKEEDEVYKNTFASANDDLGSQLFSNMVFFINREVPLDWMQLCILSFGGKVAWDGATDTPYLVDDPRITHQIVDRPMKGVLNPSREYVQPQWVFDCINAKMILPVSHYRPGQTLPPHLSPFVDDEKEGYMPRYREEIKKLQQVATGNATEDTTADQALVAADAEEEEEDYGKTVSQERTGKAVKQSKKRKMDKPVSDSEEEEEEEEEEQEAEDDANDDDDDDASEVEEEEEPKKKNNVLEASRAGGAAKGPRGVVYKPNKKQVSEAQEEQALSKIMMSKKNKRLYDRMQHGIEKKKAAIQTLETKRLKAESQGTDSGKKSKGKKSK